MQRHGIRFFSMSSFLAAASMQAHATNSLSVSFAVANLPTTISLCRDQAAIGAFGADETWQAAIDIDNNDATGQGGIDVVIMAETLPQPPTCSPSIANTGSSLVAGLLAWSAASNDFVDTGQTVAVAADSGQNSLTLSADIDGALAGLTRTSSIFGATSGAYSPASGAPLRARDASGAAIVVGQTAALSSGDVQECVTPCSAAASWYPLIDLTTFGARTAQPLPTPPTPPAFGANTIDVEFDLSALPSSVMLCNSAIHLDGAGYDLMWVAAVDHWNMAAYRVLIAAHTPLQAYCGTPVAAPLESSVLASMFRMDVNHVENGYAFVGPLPAHVDHVNGRIVVQADRREPALAGMSSATQAQFSTGTGVPASINGDFPSLVAAAALFTAYPLDYGPPFNFGGGFVDPPDDACTSSAACNSGATPAIDLLGGSMHLDDWLFRNGFDGAP